MGCIISFLTSLRTVLCHVTYHTDSDFLFIWRLEAPRALLVLTIWTPWPFNRHIFCLTLPNIYKGFVCEWNEWYCQHQHSHPKTLDQNTYVGYLHPTLHIPSSLVPKQITPSVNETHWFVVWTINVRRNARQKVNGCHWQDNLSDESRCLWMMPNLIDQSSKRSPRRSNTRKIICIIICNLSL